MSSGCQTVWIYIRTDILSVLIWVQTVCKGCQQTTSCQDLSSADICFKIDFFENYVYFRNINRVSNTLVDILSVLIWIQTVFKNFKHTIYLIKICRLLDLFLKLIFSKTSFMITIKVVSRRQKSSWFAVSSRQSVGSCLIASSTDNLRKQFGTRSGPTQHQNWSGSKLWRYS